MSYKKKTAERGRLGEDKACAFLEDTGFSIVDRNVRSLFGEIDIVAKDEYAIVFVEVKNWSTLDIDAIQYSINRKKQERIMKTAQMFLSEHPEFDGLSVRFDVLFISNGIFTHIKDAFTD